MDAEELSAAIRHRPLRAAWLVDEQVARSNGDNRIQALSQLAQACCRWWEGRNSVLIHVGENELPDEAQRILRIHDTDEVITLGNLSVRVIEDVDRIVHPLVFSRAIHLADSVSDADFQLHTIPSPPSKVNLARRNA
jgi:hypothetical protein